MWLSWLSWRQLSGMGEVGFHNEGCCKGDGGLASGLVFIYFAAVCVDDRRFAWAKFEIDCWRGTDVWNINTGGGDLSCRSVPRCCPKEGDTRRLHR